MDGKGRICDAGVDAFEDFVDFSIAVFSRFPAVDNTGVISVDDDVVQKVESACNGHDEELESEGFCPGDVSLASICLPFRE